MTKGWEEPRDGGERKERSETGEIRARKRGYDRKGDCYSIIFVYLCTCYVIGRGGPIS